MLHLEGFLVKRGERVKNWKRRFFTFQNGALAYKKNAREETPVIRREYIENVFYYGGIKHGFCAHLSSGRILYLSAPTEEEATRWYDVFEAYVYRQQLAMEKMRLTAKKHLDPIQESTMECLECM
ncbi:hypothetical protein Poli38472_014451 [Pythium oligandrum]|uniref:PH domain-containing protein n=1 Tax=Pythium oligandrum TaxID=41045 RepID=A0A8K1FEW7_PYTOL|nr:hypothetical protein Poli38472_014451 [Pythium oligandrum]|eukprot:TMW60990.1 hypothetical protein Poli38472_014451 [Pythium oligandrum]